MNFLGVLCDTPHSSCAQYKKNKGKSYCNNTGECIDIRVGKMKCDCTGTGYEGDRCNVNIDDCTPGICQHGNCTDLVKNYTCVCDVGYTGRNCSVNIDDCDPDPCKNGECVDLVNGFTCNCSVGYNGTNCENRINWCANAPCQHGGDCSYNFETYECSCLPGFTGRNCQEDINECKDNPCRYNSSLDIVENICVERSNLTAMRQYNFSIDPSSFEDR